MRWVLVLLAVSIFIPQKLPAQLRQVEQVPRFEVGAQADFNYLDGIGEWGGGIGGQFDYNFNEHFAFDSQLTYRNHDISTLVGPLLTSRVVGQTSGLFGVRAGQRVRDYGFFATARAGFMHFGTDQGVSLLSRGTVPAFDVGGTFERYLGPVILRFGLGELIVPYGNTKVIPSPLLMPPQAAPGPLGTRASPMVSVGFAIRF